jgi:Family of unknown function (DUF6492)
MNSTFGIITPSYAPDFQRCQLLAWSISEFVQPPFQHYIIVDRRDYGRFRLLNNTHTRVLTVESVLPWWIWREPLWRKLWLSLKTRPMRNWILQQIVKIAVAQQITEDVAVFIDSDVTFVRPFALTSLTRSTDLRLFRDDIGNETQRQMHYKWHQSASRLLDLPNVSPDIPDYIGNLITWKKSNVVQMCDYLEQISGRDWIQTLGNVWNFSEYVLYGTYIDRVLGSAAGQYADDHNFCHDYWVPENLDDQKLQNWIAGVKRDQVAVMISAKAGISVDRYAAMIQG